METKIEPILVSAKEAARLIGVDRSTLYVMNDSGRLGPTPVRFGRRVLWDVLELRAWVSAGCPVRNKWLALKGVKQQAIRW